VLVRSEIVDPYVPGPGLVAPWHSVKEEHICLDTLSIENAGGQAEQCVDITRLEQVLTNLFTSPPLEQNIIWNNNGCPAIGLEQRFDVLDKVELLVARAGDEV